ncbi:MAG: cysteine desulfurase [Ruminococcus sp.]|nr:cysteine desulfurase [Ruminococcus sp.]
MIYLDYSANTPVSQEVLERFCYVSQNFTGNPNSAHKAGEQAKKLQDEITLSISSQLNVHPEEVIYTSGATESNNLAIKGIARSERHTGKHIITTPLEHPSVSAPLTALQSQGYEVDMVNIDRSGKVDLEHLRSLLREDTVLFTVCAVDSELGTIQPIEGIVNILKNFPNCRLHLDATQAVGKIPFDFSSADTVSFAPHKFYGIIGIGVLIKKKHLIIEPLIHGGSSSSIYRSGTPTLALNSATETALKIALENQPKRYQKVEKLNSLLRAKLSEYPKVTINSPADAIPHILNLSVQGVKGKAFQQALSEKGVCVSVKSACSTDNLPSRAVFAVSRNRKNALSSWRISLSHLTDETELERFIEIFDSCYKEITSL